MTSPCRSFITDYARVLFLVKHLHLFCISVSPMLTPETLNMYFFKANWGSVVGLGFLGRFQWESAEASEVQTEPQTGKWKSAVV